MCPTPGLTGVSGGPSPSPALDQMSRFAHARQPIFRNREEGALWTGPWRARRAVKVHPYLFSGIVHMDIRRRDVVRTGRCLRAFQRPRLVDVPWPGQSVRIREADEGPAVMGEVEVVPTQGTLQPIGGANQ